MPQAARRPAFKYTYIYEFYEQPPPCLRAYRSVHEGLILMLCRAKSVALFDESSQNAKGRGNPFKVLISIDVERKLDTDET